MLVAPVGRMSWLTDLEERFRHTTTAGDHTVGTPGKQTRAAAEQGPAVKHELPPATGSEPGEVANARALLSRSDLDAARQLEVIRRVLELADHAPAAVAEQLLRLLVPFGREYPAVANVVANRLAALRRDASRHAAPVHLDPSQEAAAAAFNARNPGNVAAFIAATHMFASPADIDVQRVAGWQASHHLVVDGQIGAGTLAAAKAPATTTPAATASGTSAHAPPGSPTTTTTPAHKPGHGQSMAGDIPGLEANQAALLKKMREDDEGKPGHLKAEDVKFTRADIARGLYALGPPPAYSNAFRRLMVGHAVGEQGGVAPNRNFYGEECCWLGVEKYPSHGKSWARILRSDSIPEAMYWREPERFYDWGGGSIKAQLEGKAKRPNGDPTMLFVMWYSPRPAYETWDAATRAFWDNIVGWRLATFAKSKDPDVKAVATNALAGNVEAYLELVAHHDDLKGAKKVGIPPYNSDTNYKDNLRPHLLTAVTDPTLADPAT